MRIYLINLKKKGWLNIDKKQQLIDICKDLRLPSIRKMVQEETNFKNPEQAFDVLLQVLLQEKSDRLVRAKYNRSRAANFPEQKLLEELQEKELPDEAQRKLPHLKSLHFIKQGQNVILTGSPGTGKSHISVGLDRKSTR